MMIRILLAGVALALPLGSVAAAQDIPSDVADGMYITVEEVRANSAQMFNYFAGSGSGPVSKQQFLSTQLPSDVLPDMPEQQFLQKLFGLLDANSDSQLTRSEWNSQIERDLQFADQNSDGRITLKELANARKNISVGDALGMVF